MDLNLSNFTYKWNLSDLKNVDKNGLKVFSCFSSGGGSSMGYKMSGFDVVGCNEIEEKIIKVYQKNLNPKHPFNMPIQDFKKLESYPEELMNLDILDGSPPCSTFSMAGAREKKWGVKAKFREGQAAQHLDDLFFDFIDVAERLRPKVVVSENVKGMLKGNAKGYVKEIVKHFDAIGYKTQLFMLDGSDMGLPQKRQRVFFISQIKENFKKVCLDFNQEKVSVKSAFDSISHINYKGKCRESSVNAKYWYMCSPGESFSKYHPKGSLFSLIKIDPLKPSPTITSKTHDLYHFESNRNLSTQEFRILSSFPFDYDFKSYCGKYLMGMSVPPLMMHKVSEQIKNQLF